MQCCTIYNLRPSQTISFCSNLLDLHWQQKENQKKAANYPKQILKVGGHIFWSREIAFLALMQLPSWPCTGTRFLPLWEQIDKCGDCAEPYVRTYRESCGIVHGATTLQHYSEYRASSKQPQKHSWLHTNSSWNKKRAGGKLIWCNQSVFSTGSCCCTYQFCPTLQQTSNWNLAANSHLWQAFIIVGDNPISDSCQSDKPTWGVKNYW